MDTNTQEDLEPWGGAPWPHGLPMGARGGPIGAPMGAISPIRMGEATKLLIPPQCGLATWGGGVKTSGVRVGATARPHARRSCQAWPGLGCHQRGNREIPPRGPLGPLGAPSPQGPLICMEKPWPEIQCLGPWGRPGLAWPGPGLCGHAVHSCPMCGHAGHSCTLCGHAGQSLPLCGHAGFQLSTIDNQSTSIKNAGVT